MFCRKKRKAGKQTDEQNDETKVDSEEDTCMKSSPQNVSCSVLIIHDLLRTLADGVVFVRPLERPLKVTFE